MLRTMRAFGVVLAVALGTLSALYKAYKEDVIDSYDVIQPKLEALAELHPKSLSTLRSCGGFNCGCKNTGRRSR